MDQNLVVVRLKNHYFILRHGTSEANEAGIIISHPKDGTVGYGLTEIGKNQVKDSIQKALVEHLLDTKTIIISSDFLRAKETAEIAQQIFGAGSVVLTSALRERFFGHWDQTSNSNYQNVWDRDAEDSSHTADAVESVDSVVARTTQLIKDLEEKYSDKTILLVSHGDTLQILQTTFENMHPGEHRKVSSLKTGELRRLNQNLLY